MNLELKQSPYKQLFMRFHIHTIQSIKRWKYLPVLCIIFSQIQILTLIFQQIQYLIIQTPIQDSGIFIMIIYKMHIILNYTDLFTYQYPNTLLLAYMYTKIIYIIFIISYIIFTLHSKHKNHVYDIKGNILWGFICYIQEKILFISDFGIGIRLIYYQSFFCISIYYKILYGFYLASSALNIIFSFYLSLFALLKGDFQHKSSIKSSKLFVISLIYKLCATLLFEIYTNSQSLVAEYILLLINLVYPIIILILLFTTWSFNSIYLQKLYIHIIVIIFISSILLPLSKLITNNQTCIFYYWINYFLWILYVIILMFSNNFTQKYYQDLIIKPISKLETEEAFIERILYYQKIFSLTGKRKMKHVENTLECLEFQQIFVLIKIKNYFAVDSTLDDFKELTNSINEYKDESSNQHFKVLSCLIKVVLTIGLNKFPKSWKLRLAYIDSIMINSIFCPNMYLASMYLLEIQYYHKTNPEVLSYALLVKNFIMSTATAQNSPNNVEILDLATYFEKVEISKAVIKKIQAVTKFHIHFWNIFNTKNCNSTDLLEAGAKCNIQYDLFLRYINKITDFKFRYEIIDAKVYLIMATFFLIARFSQTKFDQALHVYNNVRLAIEKASRIGTLTNDNIFSPENFVIIMSGKEDTLGNIIYATKSIEAQLGYSINEIKNQKISILMPSFYESRHNLYIAKYLETGNERVLRKSTIKPMISKNMGLKVFTIQVQSNPTLESGISYISIAKPLHLCENSILITSNGAINGISTNFIKMLNLQISDVYNVTIFDICENYDYIHNVLNFFTLISIIKQMKNFDHERFETLCKNFKETFKNDPLIIVDIEPYKIIKQALIRSNTNLQSFNNEIEKCHNYELLKNYYEKFINGEGEIKFITKNPETNQLYYLNGKCKVIDQIYQNDEFVRLIIINTLSMAKLLPIQRKNSENFDKTIDEVRSNEAPNEFEYYEGYTKRIKSPINRNRLMKFETKTLSQENRFYKLIKKCSLPQDKTLPSLLIGQDKAFFLVNGETGEKFGDLQMSYTKDISLSRHKLLNTHRIGLINEKESHDFVPSFEEQKKPIEEDEQTGIKDILINRINDSDNAGNPKLIASDIKIKLNMQSKFLKGNSRKSKIQQSNETSIKYKIEQAYETKYIDKRSKLMILIAIFFEILTAIFCIYLFSNENKLDKKYTDLTKLLNSSNIAFQELFSLIYWVNNLKLIKDGYYPLDHWKDIGITDLAEYSRDILLENNYDCIEAINNFRINTNKFPNNLYNSFNTIEIYLEDINNVNQYIESNAMNFFEAAYILATKIIKIAYDYSITSNTTYNDINFLLYNNNTNNLISVLNHINSLIINEIFNCYNDALHTKILFLLTCSIGGLFIISLHIFYISKYNQFQEEFANHFRKFVSYKTQIIQHNLEHLMDFINLDTPEKYLKKLTRKAKKNDNFKEDNANNYERAKILQQNKKSYTRFNKGIAKFKIFKRIFLILIFIFTCLIGFIFHYIHSNQDLEEIHLEIDQYIDIMERYRNITLCMTLFYSYMTSYYNTTSSNNQLENELDSLLNGIRDIENDLALFIDTDQGFQYSEYLLTNLCTNNMVNNINIACNKINIESFHNGLLYTESWISANLIKIKQGFKLKNNKDKQYLIDLLKEDIIYDINKLRWFIIIPTYKSFIDKLNQDIYSGIVEGNVHVALFITLTTLIYICSTMVILFPIIKYYLSEYSELKGLLKLFPSKIFLRNAYFKLFLIKTSADSLKHVNYLLQFYSYNMPY